jgi:hypothetical protein
MADNSEEASFNGDDYILLLDTGCLLYDFFVCAVITGLLCVAGSVGNATAFVVLCKHKPQTTAIFLFKSMAISDLLLLIVAVVIYSLPAVLTFMGRQQVGNLTFLTKESRIV